MNSKRILFSTVLFVAASCAVSLAQDPPAQAQPAAPFYPLAVAQDGAGILYVVDRNLPGVWKIEQGEASIFYQGPKQYRQPLNAPRCIAVDGEGRVLVGDSAARNVFVVTPDQPPVAVSQEPIGIPMAIAIGADNKIFVADLELHRVIRLEGFAGEAVAPQLLAEVRAPRGLAVDSSGQVWVVTGTDRPVRRISPQGEVEVVVSEAKFKYPAGIVISSDGAVLVSDSYQKSISRVGTDGAVTPFSSGEPWVHPVAMALSGDKIVVADSRGGAIRTVDMSGQVETLYRPGE